MRNRSYRPVAALYTRHNRDLGHTILSIPHVRHTEFNTWVNNTHRFTQARLYSATTAKPNDETLARQVSGICVRRGVEPALQFLSEKTRSSPPDIKTFQMIMSAVETKAAAELVISEMESRYNLSPNVHILGNTLLACIAEGDAHGMEAWWDRLVHRFGESSIAYTYLIKACRRGLLLERAQIAERDARSKGLVNKQVELALLDLCRVNMDIQRARQIFEELRIQYPRDNEVYDSMITTMADIDIEEAESIAKKMDEAGIPWTRLTYHNLMKIYALDERSLDETMALFEKMRETQVKPSVVTYTLLLEACKRGRSYGTAQKMLVEMMKDGIRPNNNMLTILISLLSAIRDKRVFDTLPLIQKLELKPNLQVYTALLKAAYNLRDAEKAAQVVNMMKEDNVRMDTMAYNVMMRTLVQTDQLEEAWSALLKMKAPPDRITYTIFLNEFHHKHSDDRRVFDLISMACDSPIAFTEANYTTMLSVCQHWKRLDVARQVLFDMKRKQLTPNQYTMSAYMAVCFACDRIDDGLKAFQDMSSEYGIYPTEELLRTLLRIALDKPQHAAKIIEVVEAANAQYLTGLPTTTVERVKQKLNLI